ncbi:hypothetical protein PaeCFBP13512_18520 [Paenibacillus sp. CFBP13512]|uniref:hypothetical protein n=1 Tax=Paenibacillus sp. CFBP13512 TaxID=2184007 RepID=UPI0010C0122A|nr:hypothetical protein [Paenibacillus sp. CFBP13512]TKJ87218.1 hypothetical protein PaeCFBP13512_18520 [Paenibacillus sp. CFBP13512]
MIKVEELLNKGFQLKQFDNQEGNPFFYQYVTNNQIEVKKLTKLLDEHFLIFDESTFICTIELKVDYSYAQYLICDSNDSTYYSYGQLDLKEFESTFNTF